jgi:hypothetical protein
MVFQKDPEVCAKIRSSWAYTIALDDRAFQTGASEDKEIAVQAWLVLEDQMEEAELASAWDAGYRARRLADPASKWGSFPLQSWRIRPDDRYFWIKVAP